MEKILIMAPREARPGEFWAQLPPHSGVSRTLGDVASRRLQISQHGGQLSSRAFNHLVAMPSLGGGRSAPMLPPCLDERLSFILREAGIASRPDEYSLNKLATLWSVWRSAAVACLEELSINLGVGQQADSIVKTSATVAADRPRDAQGRPHFVIQLSGVGCGLRSTANEKSLSMGVMAIVKRWEALLKEYPPSLEAACSALDDSPTAIPPPAAIFLPPHAGVKRPLEEVSLPPPPPQLRSEPEEQECAPAAQPAKLPAERAHEVDRIIKDATMKRYDLRYRLLAIGAAREFVERPEELRSMLRELCEALDREASPRELNRIATRFGVSMCFSTPRPNHVLVYQVRVQLDGSIVCSLPVEQGVTVAHRRLGDRLLRVRFAPLPADASREDGKAREKLKRQIVRGDDGPLKVAGRSFVHLVHKDAEKSEEQSALWFVAVDKNKGSPELALQYVRDLLLDSQSWKDGVPSKGKLNASKLNARLCLAFSTTYSVKPCCPTEETLDLRGRWSSNWTWHDLREELSNRPLLPTGRVQCVIVDDLVGTGTDPDGSAYLMSDGAGLIAHNLARHIPACQSGQLIDESEGNDKDKKQEAAPVYGVPLLSQVRIFHRGSAVKGMLLADSMLPDGYLVLCASMVKVHGRRECPLAMFKSRTVERSAFEVICTSNEAREGRLTPQLVPLLEHACIERTAAGENKMVALLLALQNIHVQRILELRDSDTLTSNQLRKLVLELPPPANDMILAGFTAEEPWLRHKVARAIDTQLERLASGRIVVPGSLTFIGIPDFTGSLPEGTVAAVADGRFFEEEEWLIYRAPGTHAGDVRKVRAVVPPPELRSLLVGARHQLQNALFFSVCGERPLADMLSGGDYDGDQFLVLRSFDKLPLGPGEEPCNLVQAFHRKSEPWSGEMPPPAPGFLCASAGRPPCPSRRPCCVRVRAMPRPSGCERARLGACGAPLSRSAAQGPGAWPQLPAR